MKVVRGMHGPVHRVRAMRCIRVHRHEAGRHVATEQALSECVQRVLLPMSSSTARPARVVSAPRRAPRVTRWLETVTAVGGRTGSRLAWLHEGTKDATESISHPSRCLLLGSATNLFRVAYRLRLSLLSGLLELGRTPHSVSLSLLSGSLEVCLSLLSRPLEFSRPPSPFAMSGLSKLTHALDSLSSRLTIGVEVRSIHGIVNDVTYALAQLWVLSKDRSRSRKERREVAVQRGH